MSRSSAAVSSAISARSRASCDAVGLRVGLRVVERRIEVGAAREEDPVERLEGLLDGVLARRHDERPAAGTLDRADVSERDERSLLDPGAPRHLLGVRGDADDGLHPRSNIRSRS